MSLLMVLAASELHSHTETLLWQTRTLSTPQTVVQKAPSKPLSSLLPLTLWVVPGRASALKGKRKGMNDQKLRCKRGC